MRWRRTPTLSPAMVDDIQRWLAERTQQSSPHVSLQGSELAERIEGIRGFGAPLAMAVDGSTWSMLCPLVRGSETRSEVVVVQRSGPVVRTTWNDLAADPSWWITPETRASGCMDWVVDECLAFDGDTWAGLMYEPEFGENESAIDVDGRSFPVFAGWNLAYRDPPALTGPLDVLVIETSGFSITTGPIGVSLRLDRRGGLWYEVWNYSLRLLPRPDSITEAISHTALFLEYPDHMVSRVRSDVLAPHQLIDVVDHVEHTDEDFDPDAIRIECVGFSGSYEEFRASTR